MPGNWAASATLNAPQHFLKRTVHVADGQVSPLMTFHGLSAL